MKHDVHTVVLSSCDAKHCFAGPVLKEGVRKAGDAEETLPRVTYKSLSLHHQMHPGKCCLEACSVSDRRALQRDFSKDWSV